MDPGRQEAQQWWQLLSSWHQDMPSKCSWKVHLVFRQLHLPFQASFVDMRTFESDTKNNGRYANHPHAYSKMSLVCVSTSVQYTCCTRECTCLYQALEDIKLTEPHYSWKEWAVRIRLEVQAMQSAHLLGWWLFKFLRGRTCLLLFPLFSSELIIHELCLRSYLCRLCCCPYCIVTASRKSQMQYMIAASCSTLSKPLPSLPSLWRLLKGRKVREWL